MEAIVDFPEPDRPTIAVHEFELTENETFLSTLASGLDGYLKSKLVN